MSSTQTIFVNTEANFGQGGGDQVNRFKIDFNTEPLNCQDDERIRINVSQFQMEKNWIDIYQDNQAFRLTISGATDFADTDQIFFIPANEISTQAQLARAFAERLESTLQSRFTGAGFISLTTFGQPDRSFVSGDINNNAQRLPNTTTNLGNTTMDFTLSVSGGGVFTGGTLTIQCLQLPASQQALANAGGLVVNNQAHLFNDSYILMGGLRIETYEEPAVSQSFRLVRGASTLRVRSFYPMNNHPHTLPYIYLRLDGVRNQATQNMIDSEDEHLHAMTYSTVIAKIPRVIDNAQQIEYKFDNNTTFHTISTDRHITSMIFSLCDHRGRPLPTFPATTDNLGGQTSSGNAFCNFTLNVEKVKIPFNPRRLDTPERKIPPPARPDLGFGLPNPTMPYK